MQIDAHVHWPKGLPGQFPQAIDSLEFPKNRAIN